MTNKTKYQTKVLELLDDLLTEKTEGNEKLKQNVKEYIGSKVASIDAVLFGVDGENIALDGIIEQVKNENIAELESLLDKYGLGFHHDYLSGEYQVYIRLDDKEIVINKGSEKDFVLFIGDLNFEMTLQELETFLSRNVQKEIGSILNGEKLNKVFNLLVNTGYAFGDEDNKISVRFPGRDLEFFENKGQLYLANLVGYVKKVDIEKEEELHSTISKNALAEDVIEEVKEHLDSCHFNYTTNYYNRVPSVTIKGRNTVVTIKAYEEINKITIQAWDIAKIYNEKYGTIHQIIKYKTYKVSDIYIFTK